jgi:hypothetical protein
MSTYLFFVVLAVSCILATMACAVIGKTRYALYEVRVGRISEALAIALVAITILSVISGLILTFAAVQAPGLSRADTARMQSNGLAEALYNSVGFLVALPAALVARRSLRRRSANGAKA